MINNKSLILLLISTLFLAPRPKTCSVEQAFQSIKTIEADLTAAYPSTVEPSVLKYVKAFPLERIFYYK